MSDPRTRLLEERERLAATARAATGGIDDGSEGAAMNELSTYDQHPADVGTETFMREADESIAESVRAELAEVDAALARVDDGSYGTCQACGRPIGAERLDALPATRFCVDDAARAEAEAVRAAGPLVDPDI
ncbi:MAG TPA: TraR/DksA C4-type zinc finger protein [Acidimicrobiales bacterium]|nr:TraR/DksA C4-type zinc finger protein [Acidimicrobiales bacterium]